MTRTLLVVTVVGLVAAVGAQTPPSSTKPTTPPPPASTPATPPAPAPGTSTPPAEVAPVLADVDRLKVINAIQSVEIATLKLQAAATEATRARAEADKVIAAVQVPGWVLTEQLEYVRPPKTGRGGQ